MCCSLDWLQSNPYISGWFGRPFSLCANPLALPMNLVDLFNSLQMEQKVHEQLVMRPFRRSLCGVDGPSSAWKQREYLLKWQPKFEEACVAARLSSLWPVNPDTMHYEDCESIHTALVVLFVKGRVDIMRSVGFEKTTMSNSALKKSMNLMMKTALGPAGGKKSGKWRGTMDLSTKDSTGSSRQSQSAGNLYAQVLPKLKRRPTMPWPEDESDRSKLGLDVALGETVGVESKLEAVRAPPPVIIDAPFEIHLSIKTSPEKKKKSKIKKVKKIKESAPVTMPDVIKLGTGKAKTISMAAASDFDSDDNSSSAASLRPPPKLAVLEPVALLTKSKKAKKNSKKGVRELLEAAKGAHVSSPAKKAHGVTSRTVGSPVEGQRPVISRASFPADIKLTRKVTSPSKKQNKK